MKIWQIVVPGLFGLALAGCQTDPSIALLERDNFKKEQEINRLTYENQELKEALEAVAPADRGTPPRELAARTGGDGSQPNGPARDPPWCVGRAAGTILRRARCSGCGWIPLLAWHGSTFGRGSRSDESSGRKHRQEPFHPPADRSGPHPIVNHRSAVWLCPITTRLPKSRYIQRLRGGLARAAGPAMRACWWLLSPAILGATSSMCPATSVSHCSTRPWLATRRGWHAGILWRRRPRA